MQVAFFGPDAHSSINSYGYSPHPLRSYLEWLRALFAQSGDGSRTRKQVIVSITGSLQETKAMLEMLQRFANEVGEVIAVECVVFLLYPLDGQQGGGVTERGASRFGAGSTPRAQTFQVPDDWFFSFLLPGPTPNHAPLRRFSSVSARASGHPPPAYHQGALAEYMKLLASFASQNLLVGVKLPPFTYQGVWCGPHDRRRTRVGGC